MTTLDNQFPKSAMKSFVKVVCWIAEAAVPLLLVLVILTGQSLVYFLTSLPLLLLLVYILREAGRAALEDQEQDRRSRQELTALEAHLQEFRETRFN